MPAEEESGSGTPWGKGKQCGVEVEATLEREMVRGEKEHEKRGSSDGEGLG